MNFSECSKALYPTVKARLKSQGKFVANLFIAMGSKYFSLYSDHAYEKKLFNGSKPLTQDLRDSIPSPIDVKKLAGFFAKYMDDSKIREIALKQGLLASSSVDKQIFAKAIAYQYKAIFDSENFEAPSLIHETYQKINEGVVVDHPSAFDPLYPGDNAYNHSRNASVKHVGVYQQFEIDFDIQNAGNVSWKNRKLVFLKTKTLCPVPIDEVEITVPSTEPNRGFKARIKMDARGAEGKFVCHFEMQDIDGNNCFPGRSLFDIPVTVLFEMNDSTEEEE